MPPPKPRSLRLLRLLTAAAVAWLILVALPSLIPVRALLITPLYVHNPDASGDLAYVMADGDAYQERLHAASDLYHLRKISNIYILNEKASTSYNFTLDQSQSKAQAATGYLEFLGVPRAAIHCVGEPPPAWMGSLSEAQALSHALPENTQRVVVVTSAPHTRRSLLCFQRSLPASVAATSYAATPAESSAELFQPIWQEYFKLIIYSLIA